MSSMILPLDYDAGNGEDAATQEADGAIPWSVGEHTDVWNHLESAMGLLDLIRTDDLGRLKTCAADDCDALLVDLSRNSSKRYCDTGNCGNRANVAAYRARRRETA